MSGIGPGDVVVCVDTNPIECHEYIHTGSSLKEGAVYRVNRIKADVCGCVTAVIGCGGVNGLVQRFRKLNDEPEDAKLIARIKSSRPIKQREAA